MSDSRPSALRFPTTDWILIGRTVRRGKEGERRQALSDLVARYLPALRAYLRVRRHLPGEKAEDLLQAFLADKVLEQDLLARADRTRGRFRSFLLTALDRFLVSQHRRERAAKRNPQQEALSLEQEEDLDPSAPAAADVFELEWTRQVLELAVGRVRSECQGRGRGAVWGVFEARVLRPALHGAEPPPLEELARRFGLDSVGQAYVAVATAKRMFARNLRTVVREYTDGDETEAEEEIGRMMQVLSRPRA